jgi:predicted phage tail protein
VADGVEGWAVRLKGEKERVRSVQTLHGHRSVGLDGVWVGGVVWVSWLWPPTSFWRLTFSIGGSASLLSYSGIEAAIEGV